MAQQRVRAHTRRMPDGRVVQVEDYKRTGLDAIREKFTPVQKQRKSKRKSTRKNRRGLLSPGRGWDRIVRAFDHARKRRKTTAAVLALGGVAEIGGFLAARGVGSVVMLAAMALTALAGGLLMASGGQAPTKKKRAAPRGGAPRRSGSRPTSRTRPAGTTRKRTVYDTPESNPEAFERKHENTTFEDEDGKKYDVHGNQKDEAA